MPKPGNMDWGKVRIQDLESRLWKFIKTLANWTNWLSPIMLETKTLLEFI